MPSFSPHPLGLGNAFVAAPIPHEHGAFAAGPAGAASAAVAAPEAAPPAAWQEGYDAGLAEGLARGREEGSAAARAELPFADAEALRTAAAALDGAAGSVAALRRGYLAENRRMLVEISVAVAERVLGQRIEADPDLLAGVVERALTALGDAPDVRLCLSERDHRAVVEGGAADLAALAERRGLAVEVDPGLAPGDVRVLAGRSRVDARIEAVLRRIREELAAGADDEEEAGS